MAKFKAGDKVRVVRARVGVGERGKLVLGEVHTVAEYHECSFVLLGHPGFFYDADRFELYTTPTVKVGDKVRIAQAVASHDVNGMGAGVKWRNSWTVTMDGFVGHVGEVKAIHGENSGVVISGAAGYKFPLAALEVVEAISNGVDGKGNKIIFTEDDLKPGMRVVTERGCDAIVFGEYDSGFHKGIAIVYKGSSNWDFLEGAGGFKEVYADPAKPYALIDPSSKGALLFKAVDHAEQQREQAAADAAVAQAEAALKAAQDARAALK